MNERLNNPNHLARHIRAVLKKECLQGNHFASDAALSNNSSAVLFLIGNIPSGNADRWEPCLILNRRSKKVPQSGDLCCPGGGIDSRCDPWLGKALRLPFSPLRRCPDWRMMQRRQPQAFRRMSLLLATCLRESFEEMRLNPLQVDFLGPLPPQRLVSFRRMIYPLVCRHRGRPRFRPNWEVDRIVSIPLRALLDPGNYARYRLTFRWNDPGKPDDVMEHLCLRHREGEETENLWGATFRITMAFLEMVFDFHPPAGEGLPLVEKTLDETYFSGHA
jgi:8-oxo-dGTP pyrophosphatase MutT (NUDIX family)